MRVSVKVLTSHPLFPIHYYYGTLLLLQSTYHFSTLPFAVLSPNWRFSPPLSRDSESQPSHMRSQRYVPDPAAVQGLLEGVKLYQTSFKKSLRPNPHA